MRRNTLVLSGTLFLLAVFAWAGWANWEYRRQAAERLLATAAQGELVVSAAQGEPELSSTLVGKPAPELAIENLATGKRIAIADLKGKAVLINFWATWCAPCKIETPWLIELRNKYAAQGFEVVGISADDLDLDDAAKLATEKKEIARFVDQLHIPYPVLIGGDSLSKTWGGLDQLPTSFFVDRKGTIVAAQIGLTSKDELEGKIQKAMGN